MPVFVSMLRGVNVGAHNRIKMDALRAVYESLGLEHPRAYVQSGNIIFRTNEKSPVKLAKKIQAAIVKTFGFSPAVVLRTTGEIRSALTADPFAKRKDIEPDKVLVTFLVAEPSAAASAALSSLKGYPEEMVLKGRELYIYFPNGAGNSKLPWSRVDKLLGVTGTARNWNSITKMLQMAEEMESE
jgi:uncharacterized protein (DUF1697 family)